MLCYEQTTGLQYISYVHCISFSLKDNVLTLQRVQCGEYFTVAGTTDNDLLFWGTRFKTPPKLDDSFGNSKPWDDLRVQSATSTRSHSRQNSTASMASVTSVKDATENNTKHDKREGQF